MTDSRFPNNVSVYGVEIQTDTVIRQTVPSTSANANKGRVQEYRTFYKDGDTKIYPVDETGKVLPEAKPIYSNGLWDPKEVSVPVENNRNRQTNVTIDGLQVETGVFPPSTAEQTIYKDAKIGDMINMSVGDQPIWNKTGYNLREYSALVIHGNPAKRKTVKEVLSSKPRTLPTDVGMFRYSNAVTDIIGRLLDIATPDGLAAFAHTYLAESAGNKSDAFILVDKNGWPLAHTFIYATRDDWMRMAIKIGEDWRSDSCIGEFLRQ